MTIKEDLAIEMALAASVNSYLWTAWERHRQGWTASEINGFLTLLNHVCDRFQDLRNHVNGTLAAEPALIVTDDLKTQSTLN